MRSAADLEKLRQFLNELSARTSGPGIVYLVGGSSALALNFRDRTVDIDLKLDPEPPGALQAIARLKDEIGVNIELAAPDQFLPELPGWRERSLTSRRSARSRSSTTISIVRCWQRSSEATAPMSPMSMRS